MENPAGQPRRLTLGKDRGRLRTAAVDWTGRGLAIGGAMAAVLFGYQAATHHMALEPAGTAVVVCVIAVVAGVALSSVAAAGFNVSAAPGQVRRVIWQDLAGLSVLLFYWVLSLVSSGGSGGGGGGDGGRSGPKPAPKQNFATQLLDPGEVARVLGVSMVQVEAEGFSSSVSSLARASYVDARGIRRPPVVRLTVIQGKGSAIKWERVMHDLQLIEANIAAGPDRLALREGDTVIELRVRGLAGDSRNGLLELGRQAVTRLYAPVPAGV